MKQIEKLAKICVLKHELVRRFSYLENDALFTTATLLDPRYKSKFFGNHTYVKEHVIKNILDMFKEREFYMNSVQEPIIKRKKVSNEEPQPSTSTENVRKCTSLKESMALLMDSSDSEDEQITNESNHSEEVFLKKNIADYLSEKRIDSDVDPLLWWKTNKKKYEILSDIARQLLCIPPTSVPSERFFSGASLLYTPHRNRLDGEKASKLLFLKFNMPLLEFNY